MFLQSWVQSLVNRMAFNRTRRRHGLPNLTRRARRRIPATSILHTAPNLETLENRSLLSATITSFTPDTGFSATDRITNDVITLRGSSTQADGTGVGVAQDGTPLGSASVFAGAWTFVVGTPSEASHNYTAKDLVDLTTSAPFSVTSDYTALSISSISRSNPTSAATNANTLTFLATFQESVYGLTASNLSLVTSGFGTAPTIQSITGSGTGGDNGATWSVVVSGGDLATGDGTHGQRA